MRRTTLFVTVLSLAAWHGEARADTPLAVAAAADAAKAQPQEPDEAKPQKPDEAKPQKPDEAKPQKPDEAKAEGKDPEAAQLDEAPQRGTLGTLIRNQMRGRADLSLNQLRRDAQDGRASIFNTGPRMGLWLRLGLWLRTERPREPKTWRPGLWLGYRFEPGATNQLFESETSKGATAWMSAHDLNAGFALELGGQGEVRPFLRPHAGLGLSLTTLQLKSLDDEHVYSHTSPSLNFVGSLEAGLQFEHWLELFAGYSYWHQVCDAQLPIVQSSSALGQDQIRKIDGVSRSGHLFTAGLGFEF